MLSIEIRKKSFEVTENRPMCYQSESSSLSPTEKPFQNYNFQSKTL